MIILLQINFIHLTIWLNEKKRSNKSNRRKKWRRCKMKKKKMKTMKKNKKKKNWWETKRQFHWKCALTVYTPSIATSFNGIMNPFGLQFNFCFVSSVVALFHSWHSFTLIAMHVHWIGLGGSSPFLPLKSIEWLSLSFWSFLQMTKKRLAQHKTHTWTSNGKQWGNYQYSWKNFFKR